jgi:hypothetical protein
MPRMPRLRQPLAGSIRVIAFGLIAATLSAEAQAPIDLRLALVIGNAAYPGAALVNPTNDARAMSEALKAMGFTIVELRDASKAQMEEAVAKAGAMLAGKQGVGMFYYAGHGLQLDWRNYMVPIDAKLQSAADVPRQTIDMQAVLDAFKAAGTRMNIVVLDACRDNPFAGAATGKGLAQADAPPGTLLAFATAPGNVAEDGSAALGNGLYTSHLSRELREPRAKIEDVFKRVRFQVRKQSEGRQVPWESTSLEDDFYFDPSVQVVKLAESERAKEALQALTRENAEWTRIKESTAPDAFYAFLQKYPNGMLSEQAQFRLDQLQKSRVVAQPGADGVVPLASGASRYALGDEMVYDIIDGFTKASRRSTMTVTFASDLRVELNGGSTVFNQMGGIILNNTGRKDPPLLEAPAELAVGKKWRSAFINMSPSGARGENFIDFKVVALEEVTVPAGSFQAFRIEGVGESRGQGFYTVLTNTTWIDPKTMLALRRDVMRRSGGTILAYESFQLVSLKRAGRPAGT